MDGAPRAGRRKENDLKIPLHFVVLLSLVPLPVSAQRVEPRVAVAARHRNVNINFKAMKKPLFHGVGAADIRQGELNNCTLVGSMAAVAHSRPDVIKRMIVPSERLGWLNVAFGGKAARRNLPKNDLASGTVSINNEVAFAYGEPLYAFDASAQSSWVSMVEKAYAKLYGGAKGYEALDHGGLAETALSRLTGGNVSVIRLFPEAAKSRENQQSLWKEITHALDNRLPTTLLSPARGEQLPGGLGIFPWHTYALVGAKTHSGAAWVELYNPHCSSILDRGKFFKMPLEEFAASFEEMFVANPVP